MKKIIKKENFNKYALLSRFVSNYDYSPLIVILFYLIFTYLLHLFLNESPSTRGFVFMIIIFISIIIGYILPNSKEISVSSQTKGLNIIWQNKSGKIYLIIFFSSIITTVTSINAIISYYPNTYEMMYYLRNPGQAYMYTTFINRNSDLFEQNAGFGSFVSILLSLLSATKYIFFILSILYWKHINIRIKVLSIVTFIIYSISSFLIGSMITVGSILMAIIPIVIVKLKYKSRVGALKEKQFSFSTRFKIFVSIAIGAFIILFFMSNRISEENNLLEGAKMLGFYLSHGYNGLDHCLRLPFEPTFGFTSFRGITNMFVKYLGVSDLFQNSYLMRNEFINNYPALSIWSTIFPWLASDFSFYLLPFIIGLISFQFSILWNRTIRTGNPYGYLLLGQFFIFWFMIPANNQVFHTFGNATSFLLILYIYIRSKRNFMNIAKVRMPMS